MSDISIPTGAFAAMKAGVPAPAAPKVEAPSGEKPKTITRKKPSEPPPAVIEEQEAPPEGMTAAEKKIWKLKADGEEFDFDATDEENIKREIMKARGADKRFDSAAAMKKQAETFFEMIKNPDSLKKVLADPRVNVDLKKLAKDLIWEEMETERLNLPENKAEKDQREKDRELENYRSEKSKADEKKASEDRRERETRWESEYEKKIISALEIKGVHKNENTVKQMAYYLEKAIENGHDLSPEDIASLVKSETSSTLRSYADALNEDQFLEFLGEHNAEKLRKADLKRLRSAQGNPFPPRNKPRASATPLQPKKMQATEWKDDVAKSFMSRPR